MTKPKITITIDGPAGSGKSTLAQHLATYLSVMQQREVALIDDDTLQHVSHVHNPILPKNLDAAVTIIVEQK